VDGVRYFLFRTLASLLGVPRQMPPLVKQETEDKAYEVAARQVEKKVHFPKATPRQEVEGYKYLRLQAVRVLAQSRSPVAGKERPGLVLARVAGNDENVVPPPRIEERVEAAIGLARMAAAKTPNFQPDYAAYQVGWAVAYFGDLAKGDLGGYPPTRLRPWKVDAARLNEALDVLKAEVKVPYVQKVVGQCQGMVLSALERNSEGNANALEDWLGTNEPPSKSLFAGDDEAVVKRGAVTGDEKLPEKKADDDKKKPADKKKTPDKKKPEKKGK
jgi:hypothetical protein